MYLYDKNGKDIDIYSFEPIKSALVEYKTKLIKAKNMEDLFYRFETTSEIIKNRFLKGDELDIQFIQSEDKSEDTSKWWAEIGKDTCEQSYPHRLRAIEQQELVQKYINGEFSHIVPTRIFEFIAQDDLACYIYNFLVTTSSKEIYSNIEKRPYYSLENIIDLPTELCTLQLLESGKFSQLLSNGLSFEEQLELFKVRLLDSVSAEQMQKMFEYGLLSGAYEETMGNVSITQKILSRKK